MGVTTHHAPRTTRSGARVADVGQVVVRTCQSSSRSPASVRRRLIVPLVLVATSLGVVTALSLTVGCGGGESPPLEAGIGDGSIDTPIV